MVQPLWETIWWFPIKQNILLLYDLAVMLLDIYPKEYGYENISIKNLHTDIYHSYIVYNIKELEAIQLSIQ